MTERDNENDEDDDSHLCVKCKNIIIGIDNYVLHRKSKCGFIKIVQVRKCIISSNSAADLCYYSHSSVSKSKRYKSTNKFIRHYPVQIFKAVKLVNLSCLVLQH